MQAIGVLLERPISSNHLLQVTDYTLDRFRISGQNMLHCISKTVMILLKTILF